MTEPRTATALIDAAEGLFAADGFDGASLRAVMREAGTDPGAIHYHFGGRRELAVAVLERLLVPLNDRRLELLEGLEVDKAAGAPVLVEALIRPDIELAHSLEQRGSGRARLIGSIYLHPSAFVTVEVERRFAPVAERFLPHLIGAAPAVDPSELAWRIRWCLFGTLGALLSDPSEPFRQPADDLVRRLVSTLTPAITALETP